MAEQDRSCIAARGLKSVDEHVDLFGDYRTLCAESCHAGEKCLMVGHRVSEQSTGIMVESVDGGVLRQNRQSFASAFSTIRSGSSFGLSDVHHTDALKAAEHYGGVAWLRSILLSQIHLLLYESDGLYLGLYRPALLCCTLRLPC
jgi:hypothetical protein